MKAATNRTCWKPLWGSEPGSMRTRALSQIEVRSFHPSRGFSLLEMMVVIVIVSIVLAAILTQVKQAQQRAMAEQGKLDQFEGAQNFVDQIATDARQMGYPNLHNVQASTLPLLPPTYLYVDNYQVAAGLVSLSPTQLIFEGDVNGSGDVSIVSYAVNGDGKCSTCLERAQITKAALGATSNAGYVAAIQALLTADKYTAEIQNVQNGTAIFSAYNSSGAVLPTSFNMGSDPTSTANARVIQITLDVSDPTELDPVTHQALEANITSRAQIVNCSMATSGLASAGGIQLTCN